MSNGAKRLAAWILEREAIRLRRAIGTRASLGLHQTHKGTQERWTDDPILRDYKFCNVRREDDRVTRWIAEHWRNPHQNEDDVWFAMVVARFINWPGTLQELDYPVPWNPAHFLQVMDRRKTAKEQCYTGAYMVRADREHADKAAYQEAVVFTPMWEARERLRPKPGDTLNSWHMLLGQFHGLGSFMAAQIVADMKYVYPFMRTHNLGETTNRPSVPLADDWWTFAASGPGSRRGLNRVLDRDKDSPWTEENWRMELGRLAPELRPYLQDTMGPMPIHAQDLQNCLCEFDKYERVKLGEGRPRSKFP